MHLFFLDGFFRFCGLFDGFFRCFFAKGQICNFDSFLCLLAFAILLFRCFVIFLRGYPKICRDRMSSINLADLKKHLAHNNFPRLLDPQSSSQKDKLRWYPQQQGGFHLSIDWASMSSFSWQQPCFSQTHETLKCC